MTTSLRFAACQFPVSGSILTNSRYILRYMRRASDAGADIVHFPEAALPGYARLDFLIFGFRLAGTGEAYGGNQGMGRTI